MPPSTDPGGRASGEQPPVNLVANGGFEVNLDHWDDSDPGVLFPIGFGFQHSGDGSALFIGNASLTQSVSTVAGQLYTLDFWIADYSAGTFDVIWNGASIGSFTFVGSTGYQEITLDLVGTGSASDLVLSLNATDENPTFVLDDVWLFIPVDPIKAASSGSIRFRDADLHDSHSAMFTAGNGGLHTDGTAYLGTFNLSPVTEANGA